MIKLISPVNGAKLSILTDIQKEFIRRTRPMYPADFMVPENAECEDAYPWLSEEFKKSVDPSHPAAVIFKWTSGELFEPIRFEISISPDFKHDDSIGIATVGEIYSSAEEPGVYCLRADNLLSGTTYYWRVSAGDFSETRSFTTEYGEFRTIRAGALTNVRDMGGRINADGRRIKQGLIFRGPSLEELVERDDVRYDSGGWRVMKDDLKIKTEIDLRGEGEAITESVLGNDVKFKELQFYAWGGTLNDGGRAMLRDVLEMLSDRDNLPAYFHCAVGADRTGTIGAYLDAILGMSEEDIRLNFNFTSLGRGLYRHWNYDDGVIAYTEFLEETYPDATLAERMIINLMKSGISEDVLDRIRDNLLE